jgi:hypothetical protein
VQIRHYLDLSPGDDNRPYAKLDVTYAARPDRNQPAAACGLVFVARSELPAELRHLSDMDVQPLSVFVDSEHAPVELAGQPS